MTVNSNKLRDQNSKFDSIKQKKKLYLKQKNITIYKIIIIKNYNSYI